jgi:Mn-dependent DtxR family transcriptional regulator
MNLADSTEEKDQTMTVKEVAVYLEVSRPTVLRMVWANELTPNETINPVRKRQPRYTFQKSEVDRLKQEREAQA